MSEQALKQDMFISYIGFFNNVAEKGKLLLYKDRLEWTGSTIVNIPINTITSAKLDLSKKHLIIRLDDKLYSKKMYKFTTPSFMNKSVRYKKVMESWRDAINNVCVNVFQSEKIEYDDAPVKYCSGCGQKLKNSANFCGNCGKKV